MITIIICCLFQTALAAPEYYTYPASSPLITLINPDNHSVHYYHDSFSIIPTPGPVIEIDLTGNSKYDIKLDADLAAIGQTIYLVYNQEIRKMIIPDADMQLQWTQQTLIENIPKTLCQYPGSHPAITVKHPDLPDLKWYHDPINIDLPSQGLTINLDLTSDDIPDVELDCDTAALGQTIYFEIQGESKPYTLIENTVIPPEQPEILLPEQTRVQGIDIQLSESSLSEMCISNIGIDICHWEPYATHIFWTLSENAGQKTIYFSFKDQYGQVISQTTTINYAPNHKPLTFDKEYENSTGSPMTFQLKATDDDNDPLTFAIATPCSLGTLTLDAQTGTVHYTPIENGTERFTFLVHDGFISSEQATIKIIVNFDNAAPVIHELHNDTLPKKQKIWSWSATDDSPPVTYQYVIDQIAHHEQITGSFSDTHTAQINGQTGVYYLHVQAKDQVGNISNVISVSAVLDNTPPAAPIINNADHIQDNVYHFLTNTRFSFDGTKDAQSNIFVNNQQVDTSYFAQTTWMFTPTLKEGVQDFVIYSQDTAGNESASIRAIITLDTIEPNATFTRTPSDTYLNTSEVNIQVSGNDVTHYAYVLDDQSRSDEIPVEQTLILDNLPSSSLPGTKHELILFVRDKAGNWKELPTDIFYTRTRPLNIIGFQYPPHLIYDDNKNLVALMKDALFQATIQVEGGLPPYDYTLSNEYLALTPATMPTTEVVSVWGRIPVSGDQSVAVIVRDAQNKESEDTIYIKVMEPLTILPNYLPVGTVGQTMTENIHVSGGCGTYVLTLESSSNNENQFQLENSTITFTPSQAMTETIWLTARDACGYTVRQAYSVMVKEPLHITTRRLDDGIIAQAYFQQLTVEGGSGDYIWNIYDGIRPKGLSLAPESGQFSGIPEDYVSDTITFSVKDTDGRETYASFNLSIVDELTIKTIEMPVFIDKTPYDFNIQLNGGIRPFTFELDGNLPDGLLFDSQTGRISGTAASSSAKYNVDLMVTDSFYPNPQMTWIQYEILTETEGLQIISPLILPDAQEEHTLAFQFQRVGGNPPFTWKIANGSLPKGVALITDMGKLTGSPLQNGTFSFQIQVIDKNGNADTQEQTWKIIKKLQIVSLTLPNAPKNKWYSTIVKAEGGKKPYVWSVKNLPEGLSLDPNTGTISGIPENSINPTFELSVQDSDDPKQEAHKEFKINVTDQLYIYTRNLPQGKKDIFYQAEIQGENGESPYQWRIFQGELPLGLNFYVNANKGIIEGTPAEAGAFQFMVSMDDNQMNGPVYQTYTLTVIDDVSIPTQKLETAKYASDYLYLLTAVNGKRPYVWSLPEGHLPKGLSLLTISDNTYISGTVAPDASNEAFTLQVTDANNTTAQWETSISVVNPLNLSVERMDIHDAVQYLPFQTLFTANDGTKPYAWNIETDLPDGLQYTFFNSQAKVYGIPAICGQKQFNVTVEDSSTPVDRKIYTYDLFIACQDEHHSYTGSEPYNAGILDGHLTFNSMGVPNVTVSLNDSVVGASDANGDFVLNDIQPGRYEVSLNHSDFCMQHTQVFIYPDQRQQVNMSLFKSDGTTLKFNKTDLPLAYQDQTYHTVIPVTGGCRPYIYTLCGQPLPDVLMLDPDTGEISGNSQTSGTYHLCIQAEESGGLTVTSTTNLHVLPDKFQVSNPYLNCAVQNLFYMDHIALKNGIPPYEFNVTSGQLPDGLNLSNEGIISGICKSQLPVDFELEITDTRNQHITQSFQIPVSSPLIINKYPDRIHGIAGKPLDIQFKASGGCGEKSWQLFRSCPNSGIDIFSETGQLYGIPTTKTFCTLVVQVEDSSGHRAYQDYLLDISQELSIISTELPDAFQGESYSEQLMIEGGAAPLTFTALDPLPNGLSLNSQTGEIYGWPEESENKLFRIAIHDSGISMPQSLTSTFKLSIQETLTIVSPVMLPDAIYGDEWSFELLAQGYEGQCQWQLRSGGLPLGITLNASTGQLTGTIKDTGNYQFTIEVIDDHGDRCQKEFIWTIYAPLRLISGYLPDGIQWHAYQKTLEAVGGKQPYYWALTSGNSDWPQSLSLNPNTGHISGIPDISMDYRAFRLTVYDQNGASASKTLGFSIFTAETIRITDNLPSGIVGKIYDQHIQMDLNLDTIQYPLTWSLDGMFPPGITDSCDINGCHLTGKPTYAGSYPIVVHVIDHSANPFQLTYDYRLIIKTPLEINTTDLPDAVPGTFYSKAISVTGGTGPYTFTIVSGELPEGLYFNSGIIEGTVSAQARSQEFRIQVMDHEFNSIAQKGFTLFVIGDPKPVITTMAIGSIYQFDKPTLTFTAKGGTKPYIWQLSDGHLPDGLSLSGNQFEGYPLSCGKYHFSIKLTDQKNQKALRAYDWLIFCKGDMNGDFIVDLTDLISALQMMTGIKIPVDAMGNSVNWPDILRCW
jgi:hypothetical protein